MSNGEKETPREVAERSREKYTLADATKLGQKIRATKDRAIFKYVSGYLERENTVLEVGSGRGEFAEIVRAGGFEYIGIEPSAAMRKELVDRGFEILSDPVPAIKLADESVDLVYSNALIEHLENYSAAVEFFSEARRVLRKGGIMASVVPNYDTCGMIFYLQDYQHSFVTNRGRLAHLCRDTGLEVVATPCFLTNLGLTPVSFLDRVLAHTVLLFMRSPLVCSLVRGVFGTTLFDRIYKNLYDQVLVIARKN